MSLKVWLPLNGDLKNQGLEDITVTNNGATIDSNGKIGSCYSFDGSAHYLQFDKSLTNLYCGEFSWALWVKPTDNTRGVLISEYSSTGSSNVALELLANRVIRVYWNGSPDWSTGISVTKDVWSHIAVTRKGNILKVYVNGTLVATKSDATLADRTSTSKIRIGDDYRGGTTVSYMGYLNDIRIYDHCLSPVEVKEISRALICHYKLDGPLAGVNPNLLQTTPGAFVATDYYAYKLNLTENLVKGDTYTLQMWDVNISHSGKTASQLAVGVYWGGGSINIGNMVGDLSSGHADYLYYTFTAPNTESTQADNAWLNIYNTPGWVSGSTVSLTIGKWKLEKGNKATIYCKTAEELNINNTKIIDSSGYGHHGTFTGTSTIYTDSPRYTNTIKYTTSACSILVGNLSTLVPQKEFTFSIWFKKISNEWSSKSWETIFGGPSGFEFQSKRSSTNNPVLVAYSWGQSGSGGQTYSLDTWNMVTMVRNANACKFYLNGELYYTGSAGSIPSGNYYIGSWRDASSQNYRGCFSDARIYATTLSDEDVLELYKVSAKIDNKNNIHGYSLNEYQVGKELLVTNWTKPFDSRNTTYTYVPNKGVVFNGYCSAGSDYIEINPAGNTYYYDIVVSIEAGDYFLIGFERYDKDKTVRSNNACTYILSTTPSSNIVKQRYTGTVDLSTDDVNACKYISLRVLNDWNNQNGKVATIHSISLREMQTNNTFKTKLLSTGVFKTDLLKEDTALSKVKIEKNVKTYINEFIEV